MVEPSIQEVSCRPGVRILPGAFIFYLELSQSTAALTHPMSRPTLCSASCLPNNRSSPFQISPIERTQRSKEAHLISSAFARYFLLPYYSRNSPFLIFSGKYFSDINVMPFDDNDWISSLAPKSFIILNCLCHSLFFLNQS